MKLAYRNIEFWHKGYYEDRMEKNTKEVRERMRKQLRTERKKRSKKSLRA